jgi:hypothetical protein
MQNLVKKFSCQRFSQHGQSVTAVSTQGRNLGTAKVLSITKYTASAEQYEKLSQKRDKNIKSGNSSVHGNKNMLQ